MSTPATATQTPAASARVRSSTLQDATGYKGKITRSWAQLPPEIIRHIVSHYLVLVGPQLYLPSIWEYKDTWNERIVYTALRDAIEVERLMGICMSWHAALEHHPFWQHACAAIDPADHLVHYAIIRPPATAGSNKVPLLRVSSYKHFRNMSLSSCMVCRLNYPSSTVGLSTGKRYVYSPQLNVFTVCREHRKGTFCSLCLHSAPHNDTNNMASVAENEDEETWPGVEATCRLCRAEGLWRRAQRDPLDREALGGHPLKWRHPPDWETGQIVETFVEMGEGCITDILCLAREKHWLRSNTKLAELLSQAMASTRYIQRAEAGIEGDSDEDLSGEEEDEIDLISLTEDAGGIRELAIADWARNRILDGHWVAPADQWYENSVPGQPDVVPAHHPCPWHGATYSGALEDGESAGDGEELEHPRPRTYRAPCPPTFTLCETVYRAFQRVMREILLPAMSNIVRRLLMESQVDGVDPTVPASKMSLEDVVKELRDHATWSKGVDWAERKIAREREERQRRQRSVDAESSSSRSTGSHTTSPVLSTTTLQTTPSPPPSSVKDDDPAPSPVAISSPAMPVMEAPALQYELIRPIPYIPITIAHLPSYSIECLKTVWREACAPLYQCRCSICERTMLAANTDPKNAPQRQQNQAPVDQPQKTVTERREDPRTLEIPEATPDRELRRETEEEFDADADFDDDEIESELEDADDTVPSPDDTLVTSQRRENGTPQRDNTFRLPTPRTPKRPLDELESLPNKRSENGHAVRDVTPPKRPRLANSEPVSRHSVSPSPIRLRKRSSEELEDGALVVQSGKRVKA